MKASEVRALVVSTIEGLTPAGGKLSTRDGFREVPAANPSQGSRSFVVEVQEYPHPVGPSTRGMQRNSSSGEQMAVTFAIGTIYELKESGRALDDAEGIVYALRTLPGVNNKIYTVDPITPLPDRTVLTSGDNSTVRLAAYNVRIMYDGRP